MRDMGTAPSTAVWNASKCSENGGGLNPSHDVFRTAGSTYVGSAEQYSRRTRRSHAPPVSATVDASIPPLGGGIVSDHVYRLTEVVGSSETSVAEAIRTAVRKASQTVRNIEWFEAQEIRGQVVDGDVAYFQVTVKLGFRVE
jgi:dodecin